MSNVIAFEASGVRKSRPKPDRPCEVTIFPGVRYEYHTVPDVFGISERIGAGRKDRPDQDRH